MQIFSLEYVRGDRRYTHFFAALTLFSAGMLVMVLAESMVQLILGWEIMGLCSFMLIGHWWEDEANARAALKAFFTVRVGDVGLLVGMTMLYFGSNDWAVEHGYGSGFSIRGISAWALSGDASHAFLLWGAVALFIACIGKSGQFPLHTWLPDAMAGPDAGVVAAALLDDGRRRRVPGRPALPGVLGRVRRSPARASTSSSSSPRSPSSSRACWRSCRTTSRRCSRTRRSASSAT